MSASQLNRLIGELENHLIVVENLARQPQWQGRQEAQHVIRDVKARLDQLYATRKLLA